MQFALSALITNTEDRCSIDSDKCVSRGAPGTVPSSLLCRSGTYVMIICLTIVSVPFPRVNRLSAYSSALRGLKSTRRPHTAETDCGLPAAGTVKWSLGKETDSGRGQPDHSRAVLNQFANSRQVIIIILHCRKPHTPGLIHYHAAVINGISGSIWLQSGSA